MISPELVTNLVTETLFQVETAIGAICASNLRATTAAFADALSTGGGAAAKALFNVRADLPDGDFAYMLADSAAMADQYNHKDKLCAALASAGTQPSNQKRMATFATFVNTFWGKEFAGQCFYDTECVRVRGGNRSKLRFDFHTRTRTHTCVFF